VFEPGEDPLEAAARELREETAYAPGRIRKIGEFSPNPAIMANRVHFFLAGDLRSLDKQDLDDDEYVDVELVPVPEVFRGLGRPPYVHALMASAYCLYLQAGGDLCRILPMIFTKITVFFRKKGTDGEKS
jgi:8-oxo-dGTP pyrophosphatase MutT (NUDIX family)